MHAPPKTTLSKNTSCRELIELIIVHCMSYCGFCNFRETGIEHTASNPALLGFRQGLNGGLCNYCKLATGASCQNSNEYARYIGRVRSTAVEALPINPPCTDRRRFDR